MVIVHGKLHEYLRQTAFLHRLRGKIKIGQALQLKKIPQSVFYRYLNEIDEDEYLAVLDNLLAVKRKSVHAENEYELNNKLVRFALSRGFEMKDIRHCITLSDENDELE